MLNTLINNGEDLENEQTFVRYRYLKGLRLALRIYRFIFIQKATNKYIITGDPIVKNEM
jgi:hypothetical protein